MRKTIQLKNYDSPITLKSRIRRLQEIQAAGPESVTLDSLRIKFKRVECGWLDADVIVNGKVVHLLEFSDVYEPFAELINWLLSLVEKRPTTSILNLDCEQFYQQFICDYLGYWQDGSTFKDVALFTLSADWDDEWSPAFMILPIETFVSKLYYGLHDYYLKNKPTFMLEWGNECDWMDDHNLLEKLIRNKKLEHLVPRKGIWPKEFMPSTDIPVTEADAFAILDAMLSEKKRRLIAQLPRTKESAAQYREVCVWMRNNWIYSPDGESKELRQRRAECYNMMSAGEYTYDFEWCLSDAEVVAYIFLDRYLNRINPPSAETARVEE